MHMYRSSPRRPAQTKPEESTVQFLPDHYGSIFKERWHPYRRKDSYRMRKVVYTARFRQFKISNSGLYKGKTSPYGIWEQGMKAAR
ncbi:unnamed protein product [Prunus armeniaca]|uniref:Uncharacterized protein n=1 Tax=Prunus armeniaca TaxID=36596 RepID=A0A6J5VEG3_PRUAR|nr:unnamed protein product [Prunus armeniaca]